MPIAIPNPVTEGLRYEPDLVYHDPELIHRSKQLLQVGRISSFQLNMFRKVVDQINLKHYKTDVQVK